MCTQVSPTRLASLGKHCHSEWLLSTINLLFFFFLTSFSGLAHNSFSSYFLWRTLRGLLTRETTFIDRKKDINYFVFIRSRKLFLWNNCSLRIKFARADIEEKKVEGRMRKEQRRTAGRGQEQRAAARTAPPTPAQSERRALRCASRFAYRLPRVQCGCGQPGMEEFFSCTYKKSRLLSELKDWKDVSVASGRGWKIGCTGIDTYVVSPSHESTGV